MEYITSAETAGKWNISSRRVRILCQQGRVAGAVFKGNTWLIPANAEKPLPKTELAEPVGAQKPIDRVHLVFDATYCQRAEKPSEAERICADINNTALCGRLDEAIEKAEAFRKVCPRDYLSPTLGILSYLFFYTGDLERQQAIDAQLWEILSSGDYPLSAAYYRLFAGNRDVDISNLQLTQWELPGFQWVMDRCLYLYHLPDIDYAAFQQMELHCKLSAQLGDEKTTVYYHILLAICYAYWGNEQQFAVHREAALDIIIANQWWFMLAENMLTMQWKLENRVSARVLTEVEQITQRLILSFSKQSYQRNIPKNSEKKAAILLQISMQLIFGRTNLEIAKYLGISPHTVKRYINMLYEASGVSSREELGELCRSLLTMK